MRLALHCSYMSRSIVTNKSKEIGVEMPVDMLVVWEE